MIQEFGFGDNDTGLGDRVKRFKGEKGITYRLSYVWWPGMLEKDDFSAKDLAAPSDNPERLTPRFIRAPRHYVQGVGYVINQGPEYTKLIGSPPKTQIATMVVSWPLVDGQPTKESLMSRMPVVQPWVFSGSLYELQKKAHMKGFHMHSHDIEADCQDSGYQRFELLPAKNNIFHEMLKNDNSRAQEIADSIITQVRNLAPNLEKEIGNTWTIDQLRERMGMDVSGPVGSVSGDADVDNLLSSLDD